MSDQDDLTLNNSGFHDEELNKINARNSITADLRRPGIFLLFLIMVHPYQADTNSKHSHIIFKACVQLPLYVYGIVTSIDTQMMTPPILFYCNWRLWTMGESHILTHSRNRGDTYFQNNPPEALNKYSYVMSMTYYS